MLCSGLALALCALQLVPAALAGPQLLVERSGARRLSKVRGDPAPCTLHPTPRISRARRGLLGGLGGAERGRTPSSRWDCRRPEPFPVPSGWKVAGVCGCAGEWGPRSPPRWGAGLEAGGSSEPEGSSVYFSAHKPSGLVLRLSVSRLSFYCSMSLFQPRFFPIPTECWAGLINTR